MLDHINPKPHGSGQKNSRNGHPPRPESRQSDRHGSDVETRTPSKLQPGASIVRLRKPARGRVNFDGGGQKILSKILSKNSATRL
jgi:hypothetical protein